MSWQTELVALIQPVLPRFFRTEAPQGAALPYGTYLAMGGTSLRYVEGDATSSRQALVQVDVWASTPTEANSLMAQVEDLICLHPGWTAEAQGEPRSTDEPDLHLYGMSQDFEILAAR